MRIQLLIALAAFALSCRRGGGSSSACQAPDGVTPQYLAIIRLTLNNNYRRMAFRLPLVRPTEVHVVSDPAICARAVQAMTPLRKSGRRPYTSLRVYQIGTSYATIDTETDGDYDAIYFFDSTWHMSGSEFAQ